MTSQILLIILATAFFTSLIMLGLALYCFRRYAKPRYEQGLQQAIERVKAEVGPEIEKRVKQGVVDGIKTLPTREMLLDTTRTLAKTGLDIVGDGLKIASRSSRPRRPGTPLEDD